MQNQLLLVILWWVEVVLSARVLLFTAPVLINKTLNDALAPASVSDWFVIVATITSLLYLLAGIAAIIGVKMWKVLHYFVAFIVFGLTAAFLNKVAAQNASAHVIYFVPAVFSIIVALVFLVTKSKPSVA